MERVEEETVEKKEVIKQYVANILDGQHVDDQDIFWRTLADWHSKEKADKHINLNSTDKSPYIWIHVFGSPEYKMVDRVSSLFMLWKNEYTDIDYGELIVYVIRMFFRDPLLCMSHKSHYENEDALADIMRENCVCAYEYRYYEKVKREYELIEYLFEEFSVLGDIIDTIIDSYKCGDVKSKEELIEKFSDNSLTKSALKT